MTALHTSMELRFGALKHTGGPEEEGPDAAERGPMRLERRGDPRWRTSGWATAGVCGPTPAALRRGSRVVSLELSDLSDGGVGATCREEVEPGSSIVVLFPPRMGASGWQLDGRVARCRRREDGRYEVGITLGGRRAA